MDWLDSFNQEVQEAQETQGSPPIAPAQLQADIQKEPILPMSTVEGQNGDWLDAFDTQVQEAQKVLEVPLDTKPDKTFESWFDEKYSGAKEFLEASGEAAVQLGYGAISFLPSYGMGFATMLNEKLKNVLRQDRIEETVRRGGFPVSPGATDLARKPMAQRLEEAKIKTPKEIRALADKSSEFFASVMEEPVTPGGKKIVGKAGELMEWLFHYPKLADEKLAEAGYPNLGYLTGFAGEMLLLKGLHGAAKKGKKVGKETISRFIKTVEDTKSIKTPSDLKAVSRQVDKILDQLGITEEQRIIATDKTFRAQKDVGSWIEERSRIKRDAKEVPSAKEITREAKAPSKEERIERGEERPVRLRDVEKDRLEAPKEREVAVEVKPEVELPKPSVRKLNVEEQFGKRVAGEVSDGIKIAEDMGVFETIRACVEGKKKVGEIMKEVKESRYYEEDLKDFGYSEKDLRNAIRAVKVREFGDVKIAETLKTKLEKEVKRVERIERIKEPKAKEPVELPAEMLGKDLKKHYPSIPYKILDRIGKIEISDKYAGEGTWKADTGLSIKANKKSLLHEVGHIVDNILTEKQATVWENLSESKLQKGILGNKPVKLASDSYSIWENLYTAFSIYHRRVSGEVLSAVEKTAFKNNPEVFAFVKKNLSDIKAERVDIERGRTPGVKADLKKYEQPSRVKEELAEIKIRKEAEMAPLRTAEGKIVGSKVLAMRMAKSRGLVGEVIRTPDKKGWYVKKTKEMKAKEVEVTKKFWDEMLKEEGMEVLEPETGMVRGTVEVLKSERGSVIFQPETIKKLRDSVKRKKVSEADLVAEMQRRKVPNSQILKAFPNAFKKTAVEGTSEFLKKGQDPGEFLTRRVLKKGKAGKPGRLAPAVTRGDAHVVSTFTKDLPKAPIGEKIRVLATSEGIFTRLGKDIKETFYRPMTKAAKAESDLSTALIKEGNILKKQFPVGTRQKHAERIEIYAISKQPDGLARLKAQGVKESQIPKELNAKEQVVYDMQQKVYRGLYKAINKAREAAGQQKFPAVENYSPWFHDLAKLGEIEQLSILDNLGKINKAMTRLREIPSQFEKVPRAPGLKGHEKFRAGPETPGFLRLNTFDNFAEYVKIASKAIHIGPTAAYLHELLLAKYKLAENAPNTWKFLSNWLEYQKGVEPIMYFENPVARRRIKELSSNIAVSYITYSFQSALNQMSSMNNTFALLGTFRTAEGLVKAMSPSQYARASRKSNILTVRSPEVALIESGRPHPILPGKAGRTASDIWRKTRQVGSKPLMIVDDFVAHASWLGAEAKAKRIFKTSKTYEELPTAKRAGAIEKFSRDYADDVVERAQGSASRAARAPIQRTAEGAAITTLQTFVIAQFEFISRHLLGIKNPDITKLEQVARVTRYVLGTAAISYAFDLAGMRTPTPTPAKAFLEEEQKSKDYAKAMTAAGKELVEYLPIVGGKLKYGSEVAGVVLNELVTLSEGDPTAIPRLLGIPGFNQLLKSFRAAKRGGTGVDVVFGRYVGDQRRSRPSRRSGHSRQSRQSRRSSHSGR